MNTKNFMDFDEACKILDISGDSTDEEITLRYKKLAFKYHPDKNPGRVKWATEAMTQLNLAFTEVMSHRFKDDIRTPEPKAEAKPKRDEKQAPQFQSKKAETDPEILTKKFIYHREAAKDALYRYFQYSLFSIPIREKISNQAVFNKIIFALRKSYHAIRKLSLQTEDSELLEHFEVFTIMLFSFYRASECLNILDSYREQYDVEAFRLYREGDDYLHQAHKEIFYDRHNRGYFKSNSAYSLILQAEKIFRAAIQIFADSSWTVETQIKLDYTKALKKYMELFFTDDAA
jgi:curved DNA-binding protein CbpA